MGIGIVTDRNATIRFINEFYWFHKSWDSKRKQSSFIATDEDKKIIISDKVMDIAGQYPIEKVLKMSDNYSIVRLGKRKKAQDLFSGICFSDAVEVLKNFGFEVCVIDFNDEMCGIITNEHQVIAWHNKFGILANGNTLDNGSRFFDFEIFFPNVNPMFFNKLWDSYKIDTYLNNSECTVNIIRSQYRRGILSVIMPKFEKIGSFSEKIVCGYDYSGKGSFVYPKLYSYRFGLKEEKSLLKALEVDDYKKIYDTLPESGKRFIDERMKNFNT